ncbi:hypothetical protein [Marixanthomonas ophiurae]|uniref:Uncharacterized protein n=1 Tax=Marixanthomonas ophiurae TaxID=387659 RepID=A0A3E1QDM5_9FLAO|nr:hypothetical protein [Marixanthomonas ophiurae]RFN60243.1 hypothetical protein DZ858_09440 [Marixanthomonas ophiurae]
MKLSAISWLVITTFVLLTVLIFSLMNFSFNWVFYLTALGQVFLIYTIYKILTDTYTTDKTFDDFYEDHSIEKDE